jgi:porphobilinogen synthase
MPFPQERPRRLRQNEALRRLVRETRLSIEDFIAPLFVVHGKGQKKEIASMPGQFQFSVDQLVKARRFTISASAIYSESQT